ncbi:hypothetical protein HZP59_14600 [Elizabethkingia anophelis]|nr:hypothetical protein [Elizabethkingia anophelis]MCT4092768.1 hypothetical protein [Elizabethkingia anophelis]MCT4152459.1 hypothetical protein [Elizabethkingia anophelis]
MEMPVICNKCKECVELYDTVVSDLTNNLLCNNCASEENEVYEYLEEIKDIEYLLDNNDPEVIGDRRGWKNNIKELKSKIEKLGYYYDQLV